MHKCHKPLNYSKPSLEQKLQNWVPFSFSRAAAWVFQIFKAHALQLYALYLANDSTEFMNIMLKQLMVMQMVMIMQ